MGAWKDGGTSMRRVRCTLEEPHHVTSSNHPRQKCGKPSAPSDLLTSTSPSGCPQPFFVTKIFEHLNPKKQLPQLLHLAATARENTSCLQPEHQPCQHRPLQSSALTGQEGRSIVDVHSQQLFRALRTDVGNPPPQQDRKPNTWR